MEHNHDVSLTAGLIKSYKKLSTLIWNDLRDGIISGIMPKALISQIKESHPLARRVIFIRFYIIGDRFSFQECNSKN